MYQENNLTEGNAPPPYQNDATGAVMKPQLLPGAASHNAPPPTYTLQQPGLQPAPTKVPHNVQYQLSPVQSQPVARWNAQDNVREIPHVPDKMICSILNLVCCCFWLGIPALILASQANSLRSHDPHRALAKAKAARAINIVGFVIELAAIAAILGLSFTRFGRRY